MSVWGADGKRLAEFRPAAIWPRRLYGGLALSPDGERIAYDDYQTEIGSDGLPYSIESRITVRELASGRVLAALPIQRAIVKSIAFGSDGRTLAAGDFDGHVHLWDLTSSAPLHPAPLEGPERATRVQPGWPAAGRRGPGDLEALGRGHGRRNSRAPRAHGPRAGDVPFNPQVAWSPDGLKLAATNHDNSVSIWDATERKKPSGR